MSEPISPEEKLTDRLEQPAIERKGQGVAHEVSDLSNEFSEARHHEAFGTTHVTPMIPESEIPAFKRISSAEKTVIGTIPKNSLEVPTFHRKTVKPR